MRSSTSPAGAGRTFWGSRTAASAIFVAMAVALGYLLLAVPNVELVTFTVFASGVALGRWRGALVGALAMAIYSGLNPYGSGLGVPTMFAGQVLASAFAGLVGGSVAGLWRPGRAVLVPVAAAIGFLLTAVYQSSVIVGLAAASPEFRTSAVAVIAANAFFSVLHLVSNTVVFAVLGPTVLPRVLKLSASRFASTALVVAILLVPAVALADDEDAPPVAPADTTAAARAAEDAEDGAHARLALIPPGGDVRTLLDGGVQESPGSRGARRVGSGLRGHHASVAHGALPATFTRLSLRGRLLSDPVEGGLDMLSASSWGGGAVLAPSGHDLSLWPSRTSEWPTWSRTEAAPLAVVLRPLRRPADVPFSRVLASTGSHGRSVFGAEFERTFAGGTALAGFFESEGGDSPVAEGAYSLDRIGGSGMALLESGWTVEAGGFRLDSDRTRPVPGDAGGAASRRVRSDYFVRGMSEGLHLEIYHTQSWTERDPTGPHLRAERDGLFAAAASLGLVDRAVFELSRSAAQGGLLSESAEAVDFRGEAERSFRFGGRTAAVVLGASLLGEDAFPEARVSLSDTAGWRVDALVTGRHPTVAELRLETMPLPGEGSGSPTLAGSPDLAPERAASLEVLWSRRDLLPGAGLSAGARGQLVRVFDPIVLSEFDESLVRPDNVDDESAAALSVWADVGDTASLSGEFDFSLCFVEEHGALNRNAPFPAASVRAALSFPVDMFEGYVRSRLGAVLEHESGLDRGPWTDIVEGSRLSLSLVATAEIDSVRLFVLAGNVLSSDTARVPGMEPGGLSFEAGFSWRFID